MRNEKWSRAIILVDMNAFFASIEQLDNPQWRGLPVAVTNGKQGTCIITCSYEARKFGIHTGMRLKEARRLFPRLIQAPSRPKRYAEISSRIMKSLQTITPDIEVFSVDEAFLDVTACQNLYTPIEAGKKVQALIYKVSGLFCSVGVSGDKTTAKYAAELKKPNGFTVIPPWEAEEALANAHITKLCGINVGVASFLAQYDVVFCKDMKKIPMNVVAKRFGNLGKRFWLMCQGKDPEAVHTTTADPKSVGHGKILPPGTKDFDIVKIYFRHMTEKVAHRLRRYDMYASRFFIGMNSETLGWLGTRYKTPEQTQIAKPIYAGCKNFLKEYAEAGIIRQIQVTALMPIKTVYQQDLFENTEEIEQETALNFAMDKVNQRFGEASLVPASLLKTNEMVDVIAPAWRPDGIRNNIDSGRVMNIELEL